MEGFGTKMEAMIDGFVSRFKLTKVSWVLIVFFLWVLTGFFNVFLFLRSSLFTKETF